MARREFTVKTTFTSVDKATKTIDRIQNRIKKLEATMNGTNIAFGKNTTQMFNKLNKLDNITKKHTNTQSKQNTTTKKYGSALDSLNPRLAKHMGALGSVAVKLNAVTAAISLAITGVKKLGQFMASAVDSAGDVEFALQKVANITGKTGKELENMKQIAIEVGEATKFTTKDMLEAQKNLGQVGLISAESTSQEIKMLTETIGYYAVASDRTIQQASSDIGALTSALNEPANELADKMTYLANTTQLAFKETQNLAKYGTLAKTLNQNVDSLFAMTAAYRKVAPSTRQATTHIQSFGNALKSVHKNSNKLEEMQGLASAIGKTDLIYDANGQMRDMTDIIGDLEKAYMKLDYTQEEVNTSLGKMFNSTAANVYFGVVAEGVDNVRQKAEKIGTESVGMVEKHAETMGNTYNGLIDRIQGKLDNMQTEIGESLIPMAKDMLNKLLEQLDEVNIKQIAELFKNIAKPFFEVFNTIIDLMNTSIVPLINDILSRIQPVFTLFSDIFQTVVPKLGEILSGLTPILSIVIDIFKTIWDNVSPFIDSLTTELVPLSKAIGEWLEHIWNMLQPVVAIIFKLLNDALMPIANIIVPALTKIFEISNFIYKVFERLSKLLAGLFKTSEKGFTDWVDDLGIVKGLWEGLTQVLEWVDNLLGNIFGKENWEGFKDTVSNTIDDMTKGIDKAFGWIEDRWTDIVRWVEDEKPNTAGQVQQMKMIVEGINKAAQFDFRGAFNKGLTALKSKLSTVPGIEIEIEPKINTNKITEIRDKIQKQLDSLNSEMVSKAEEMGKAYAGMYKESKAKIEKLVSIEQQISDRRQEIYNQWQDTIQQANEKVTQAERKLSEYRDDWYNKRLEKINELNKNIAQETEQIADDMLKPGSILKSDFENMFEGLSFKHFKDQLFNDFTDIETQITNSLDFLGKVYPKDIEKLYTQLETQVMKEQNKLFDNYLTDEEMYIFGDTESRKQAIKQKYPQMYNQIENELKKIADKTKVDFLESKVADVSIVDDDKLKELNKERDKNLKMTIEQDEKYQDLTKTVTKYQKQLDKVSSKSFLDNLQTQDNTLNKLEKEYKDLTGQLSFLNVQFNDFNQVFDNTDNISGYMASLESFMSETMDTSGLESNKEAMAKFMEVFADETASKSTANFKSFQESIGNLNEAFSNMATKKSTLSDVISNLDRLKNMIGDGKDLTGVVKVIDMNYDTEFLDQYGNVKIDDVSAVIDKLSKSSTLDDKIDAIARMTDIDKSVLERLNPPEIESLAKVTKSSVETNLRATLDADLQVGNAQAIGDKIGMSAGKSLGKFLNIEAFGSYETYMQALSYVSTGQMTWEEALRQFGSGATGGLIGELANPSDTPLNSYDNTPIWTNPNEYLLSEKAVKNIGVDVLNKINKTGELPVIDYNEFFKARFKQELKQLSEQSESGKSKKETIKQNTNNNNKTYHTTIKVEGKSRNYDDTQFKKALTRILRRVG